jgi:aminoglycoside 3-N-acetyltransferase
MSTKSQLAEQFAALGLPRGAGVLVHSSLKSLGWVEGGAEAVVQALVDAVGPEGTVMAPNLPFRGSLNGYLADEPTFDVRTTPSLMGAITEALRLRPDARRSLHSSHSVAVVGALQGEMTRDHEKDDRTCGVHSAYYRNAHRDNAYVLMIGVTLRNMTTFHSIEETMELPYIFSGKVFASHVIDYDGSRLDLKTRGYGEGRMAREFTRPEPMLLKEGLMAIGKVAEAECRLMDAKGTFEAVAAACRKDPWLLLKEPPV